MVLFRASNFSSAAIATNNFIVAQEGDEIDGRLLLHVEKPRRNADGWFYYLGEHAEAGGRSIFSQSPEGLDAFGRAGEEGRQVLDRDLDPPKCLAADSS